MLEVAYHLLVVKLISRTIRLIFRKTVRREIYEEVGLMIKSNLQFVYSSSFVLDNGICDKRCFLCEYENGTAYSKSPDEVAKMYWITIEDVLNLHGQKKVLKGQNNNEILRRRLTNVRTFVQYTAMGGCRLTCRIPFLKQSAVGSFFITQKLRFLNKTGLGVCSVRMRYQKKGI